MKQERQFQGIWIPAEIWLDKELSVMEKLFLVEIQSLDDPEKGCWAGNAYFADFFDISKGRCTQIIKALEEKGLVEVVVNRKGKQIVSRQIRVVNKLNKVFRKLNNPIKNIKQPYLENDEENNTLSNNTKSNKEKTAANEKSSQDLQSDDAKAIEENFFSFFWENYPNKKGRAACLKKYQTLLKNKTTRQKVHDEIMFGLSQYVLQKEDWCAWKNPLTFLNQKSWKDYTSDKPFEQQPQVTEFLNWKDEARAMENGRYVAGGWGAEVGESTDQWRARFFAWKKVGLQNWWDRDNHCWTFTEQTKAQWLALQKKADSLMGVAA